MRFQFVLFCVYFSLVSAGPPKNERQLLSKFRERVKGNLTENYMKTDMYLIRWLKATEYDPDEAEEMFYENLKWRRENNMDNVLLEDYSDLSVDYPAYMDTYDKQGRPIGNVLFGRWDIRAAVVQGKLPRLIKYGCRVYESLDQQVYRERDAGRNIDSAITVVDFEGFSNVLHMCTSCIGVFMQLVDCHESYYPFLIAEYIYINVPPSFKTMLSAASSIIHKDTVERFTFLDDKSKWMPYLDERIDRDQRYSNTGGTKPL